ncbi:MAG: hypothetical protein ACK55Z_16575 [bacterium]
MFDNTKNTMTIASSKDADYEVIVVNDENLGPRPSPTPDPEPSPTPDPNPDQKST